MKNYVDITSKNVIFCEAGSANDSRKMCFTSMTNLFHTYTNFGSFPFAPPVRYTLPVTENVPLNSKSLCKNMAHASGGQIICTH